MNEILRDFKALVVEYHEATGKPLGVTGEIAEYEAADKLSHEILDVAAAQIEAMIEPGIVLNDLGRESVALVQ